MENDSGSGRFLGHMYIARRSCGRVSAMCWDDAKYVKDTAKSVGDWIKRGLSVERIARHEGDPQPEWICRECRGKECVLPPVKSAALEG